MWPVGLREIIQIVRNWAGQLWRLPNTREHQEGGEDAETGSDNETPAGQSGQPVVDDNESAKVGVTDGDHEAPPNPNSPTPPEDAPKKPEPVSAPPAEGSCGGASGGDAEVGNPSGSDPTTVPSESCKKTKSAGNGIPDENSNSQGSETEKGNRSRTIEAEKVRRG